MLSILIPTYNYDTTLLVEELYIQCLIEQIDYEVIVGDDCSTNNEIIEKNRKINTIDNCKYYINNKNLGRGNNLNSLVQKSKFDWLLLLDCDVMPKCKNFIKNYIKCINDSGLQVNFGGILYHKNKPKDYEMLRWVYGSSREALGKNARELVPYKSCLTSNILIKKSVLVKFPFHYQIRNYGFEDLVFALKLRDNSLKINHIENEVYHLNLEESIIFLKKCESSLKNLKFLVNNKIIKPEDSGFSKLYYKLDKIKITKLISFGFKIFKSLFFKNLTSKKPSVFIFDLYRFGFYCTLK